MRGRCGKTLKFVNIAFCFQTNIFEKNETFLNARNFLIVFLFYIGMHCANVKKCSNVKKP